MRLPAAVAASALVLVLTACGGDDDSGALTDTEHMSDDVAEYDPHGAAENTDDVLEDFPEQERNGSAKLTIGDQSWEFASVVCGFGADETGDDDMLFALVAVEDEVQLIVNINTESGHIIYFGDIELQDARLSYTASNRLGPAGEDPEFIEIDGKDVSAKTSFVDNTEVEVTGEGIEGSLSATCP